MRARRDGLQLLTLLVTCVLALASNACATQPLRLSGDKRFLVTNDGSPFFWMGDTIWRLYKLQRHDVDHYLNDRRTRGFNVIQGPVLLHNETGAEFTNAYGENNTDASDPNLAWFNHIDYIIDAADARGMYVAPVVLWGGNFSALGSSQSERVANASSFGWWLGNRYRGRSNVVWIVGGEYNSFGTDNDSKQIWNALGNGLRNGSGGNGSNGGGGPLITIHPSYQDGLQSSSLMFQNAGWLSFNMVQSSQSGNSGPGAANWHLIINDYHLTPVKPVIDAEAHYEGLYGWDAFGVRRRAYWSVFAGAFGHTYGHIAVAVSYRGGDDESEGATELWHEALNEPGGSDMQHLRRLMGSRPMLKRIPADSMLVTPSGSVPNRLIATRDRFGRYAMIYVPKKNKTFTINTNSISGSQTRAWWYDCRSGHVINAGLYAHGGFRTFTTPNSGQDWVLVLDDKSQGYPKPGIGGPLP